MKKFGDSAIFREGRVKVLGILLKKETVYKKRIP
jgi:hypothetical protein